MCNCVNVILKKRSEVELHLDHNQLQLDQPLSPTYVAFHALYKCCNILKKFLVLLCEQAPSVFELLQVCWKYVLIYCQKTDFGLCLLGSIFVLSSLFLLRSNQINIIPFIMPLSAYCLCSGFQASVEQLEITTLAFHQMLEKTVIRNTLRIIQQGGLEWSWREKIYTKFSLISATVKSQLVS